MTICDSAFLLNSRFKYCQCNVFVQSHIRVVFVSHNTSGIQQGFSCFVYLCIYNMHVNSSLYITVAVGVESQFFTKTVQARYTCYLCNRDL